MRIQIPTARPDFSDWRPGLPYPDDSDLLAWYWSVAQQLRPNPVCVEIGVAYGRSLLFLASRLLARGDTEHVLYGVDPFGIPPALPESGGPWLTYPEALGKMVAEGLPDELAHIRLIGVLSLLAARIWTPASLDLVMIDGNHTYEWVLADIDAYLPLIRPGGVLAGHDYGTPQFGVTRAVDELLGRRVHHFERVWWVEYPEA